MRIVLTGPESTGKTSLALILSNHYKCTLIPEQARFFLQKSLGLYSYKDLNIMAQSQLHCAKSCGSLNVLQLEDTDLLTYIIWSRLKFDRVEPLLYKALYEFKPDAYLFCMDDLPWTFDPLREDEHTRALISKEYLSELNLLKVPFYVITGIGQQRISNAKFYINRYLNSFIFDPLKGCRIVNFTG